MIVVVVTVNIATTANEADLVPNATAVVVAIDVANAKAAVVVATAGEANPFPTSIEAQRGDGKWHILQTLFEMIPTTKFSECISIPTMYPPKNH